MKRVVALLLVMVIAFSLVACKDDELIGSWELKNDSEEGMTGLYIFDEETLTIDGMTFDYRVKGSKLYIAFNDDNEEKWSYEIVNELLVIQTKEQVVELKKVL